MRDSGVFVFFNFSIFFFFFFSDTADKKKRLSGEAIKGGEKEKGKEALNRALIFLVGRPIGVGNGNEAIRPGNGSCSMSGNCLGEDR